MRILFQLSLFPLIVLMKPIFFTSIIVLVIAWQRLISVAWSLLRDGNEEIEHKPFLNNS